MYRLLLSIAILYAGFFWPTIPVMGSSAGTSLLQSRSYVMEGSVFHDSNDNGTREPGEAPLRAIGVSNGRDIVHTDKKGRFSLMASPGQSVFPIVPDGYTIRLQSPGTPNATFHYLRPDVVYGDTIRLDFPLYKSKKTKQFSFGAIGDIQVGDSIELAYAAQSLFSELAVQSSVDFHLILGDLVNDDTRLFPALGHLIRSLPVPSWTLPGNHDRNIQNLDQPLDHFHTHFGASDYAFHHGSAFFMVFNNVSSTVKYGYEGRFNADQLEFIKNCLKNIPKDQLVILSQHIPMVNTKNRDEVLELLHNYERVLILSGHTHQVSRHFYGEGRIQELVAGAPSGTWWTGEKDLKGVPLALMQCGSPRNYFVVDVNRNNYRIRFKGIGLDENQQMHIALQDSVLTANIFAGSEKTEVLVQINDGPWHSMTKTNMVSPNVALIIEKNKAGFLPTPGNRVLPLRNRPSPHIWQLKDKRISNLSGLLKVRISAWDPFGFSATQEQWFFQSQD